MKTRTFRKNSRSKPFDHPEGGRFFILPTTAEKLTEYQATLEELAEGKKGTRLEAERLTSFIDYAASRVERIEGFVDEDGAAVESTPEVIRDAVSEMLVYETKGETILEADGVIEVKEPKVTTELVAGWVFERSLEVSNLIRGKKEAEEKN